MAKGKTAKTAKKPTKAPSGPSKAAKAKPPKPTTKAAKPEAAKRATAGKSKSKSTKPTTNAAKPGRLEAKTTKPKTARKTNAAVAKKATKVAADFVFEPFCIVDRFNVDGLAPTSRAQFQVAGEKAWGKTDVAAIFEASEEEDMFWELGRVLGSTGEPLYDVWILGAQNGTLFAADTTAETGVVLIEGSFRAENSAMKSQCAALLEAYIAARPPFDEFMEAIEAYWTDFREKEAAKLAT